MWTRSFRIQDKVFLSLLGLPMKLQQGNGDIFSRALMMADMKRIDSIERREVRKEIDTIRNTMLIKSRSMSHFYLKKPLTPFNRFELLKDENKKVIRRKASMTKRNNLEEAKKSSYLLKIKKIKVIRKRNPQLLDTSLQQFNYFNQPITSNHLYLQGRKVNFSSKNVVDTFLTTKIAFNSH